MFDFTDILHGLTWPGEKLIKFDPTWHGETDWRWNRDRTLAFGRCRKCGFIVSLHDPERLSKPQINVEMNGKQWAFLQKRGGSHA